MILPAGLGHKHIKNPISTWVVFLSILISFVWPVSFIHDQKEIWVCVLLLVMSSSYLEFRIGSLNLLFGYLFFTFVPGNILLWLDKNELALFQNHPFWGISWMSGLYGLYFFNKPFKIFYWRLLNWNYWSIQTKYIWPSIFVFSWLFHVYSYSNLNYLFGFLPLILFLTGFVMAFINTLISPIPSQYIYKFEWKRWERLMKQRTDLKKLRRMAQMILSFNPGNTKVRYDISSRLVREMKEGKNLDKEDLQFFILNLDKLLTHFSKQQKWDFGLDLLGTLPIDTSFQKIIYNLRGANLLSYGNYAEKNKLNLVAIVLYVAFLEKNFKSSKAGKILRSVDYLLEAEMESNQNISQLQYLEGLIQTIEVKNLFKQHFQFSRTAVLTGLHKKVD